MQIMLAVLAHSWDNSKCDTSNAAPLHAMMPIRNSALYASSCAYSQDRRSVMAVKRRPGFFLSKAVTSASARNDLWIVLWRQAIPQVPLHRYALCPS